MILSRVSSRSVCVWLMLLFCLSTFVQPSPAPTAQAAPANGAATVVLRLRGISRCRVLVAQAQRLRYNESVQEICTQCGSLEYATWL